MLNSSKGGISMTRIKSKDIPELRGQIIDVFEDFLEERRDVLGESNEEGVFIKGDDYDRLAEKITEVLFSWHLVEFRL